MESAANSHSEQDRLHALHSYDLIDCEVDSAFEAIMRTAAIICEVEFSLIVLVDQDRQYLLAKNEKLFRKTPRGITFCAAAIREPSETFEISDATKDARFSADQIVTGKSGIRFCAAQPLTTRDGHAIGALCLMGRAPKTLNRIQRQTLKDLCSAVMALFEQRKSTLSATRSRDKARHAAEMASEAVEKQNKQFSVALEYMSQGLCMFDGDERLVVSNNRYATMYGLSPDVMKPGVTFRSILDHRIGNNVIMGDDAERYIEERVAAVRESEPSTKIQRMSDGRVLAISHCPLPEGGWVATHEDISELAKAEALNKRLARIVEDAINEVYVFDVDTLNFLQVNKSACKNLGYTVEEMSALTPLSIKPEHTSESFDELIAPLRNGETAHVQFETVHQRKDGSLYDVKVTLQQIQSQNQRVFAAIIEDVTERNEVLQDLKQSQELFSRAFQANPIPYSISGPEGAIFDLNGAWVKMMGYAREEAIGNSAYKLGLWADAEDRANFVALLKKNRIVDNYETQYRTKSGELRDVFVSGEWVDVRGEPRMFNISHDVTERKATERRLLEDRDMLQEMVNEATADLKAKARELEMALAKEKELNELQRQFVSMASHEFRTPLAIIDATAQRLRKRADSISSQDAEKRIDKIRYAVARMTRLMESTLTAARLEEGKVRVDIQPCKIDQTLLDVCARHQEIAKQHVISCEFSNLPEVIRVDLGALEQILSNLLSNAIKYAPDAPDVRVNAFRDGGDVVIKVADHGVGIDEEDLPNMFARFFRAKTSTGIAGTGIGLNLVKTLAEMHDGSVAIESAKGVGSTFIVRLPIDGPTAQPETGTAAA